MKTVRELLEFKSGDVWSISPKAKVFDALKLMSEKEIGALIVLDENGRICGIMSERDYARKVILKGKKSSNTPVEEIMRSEPNGFNWSSRGSLVRILLKTQDTRKGGVPRYGEAKPWQEMGALGGMGVLIAVGCQVTGSPRVPSAPTPPIP